MTEVEQQKAWDDVWRPNGYRSSDNAERAFITAHPGWMQVAWAHPDYQRWTEEFNRRDQVERRAVR